MRLGRYVVTGRLGRGAMAEVLAARLEGPGGFSRRVAIKRVHPHLVAYPGVLQTLVTEGRLAAVLEHSAIVQVTEVLEDEGRFGLVMEYADAGSLARVIAAARARGQAIPWSFIAAVGAKVAGGLAYAHGLCDLQGRSLGVVHRDVSPSNILLTTGGEAKLSDFGVAAARGALERGLAGESAGKVPYMPREQALGLPADAAVDVFALGAVLYELATLEQAYPLGHAAGPPHRPLAALRADVPPGLAEAVERALSAAPAERPDAALLAGWLHRELAPVAAALAAGGFARLVAQLAPPVVPVPLEEAPAATPQPAPAPRPAAVPLIGREAEMAEVQARFEAGARVVALLGPPGIGKSALARAVAAAPRWARPLVVDVAEASGPWGLALAVGRALEVEPGRDETPARAHARLAGPLAARFGAGPGLLVLDGVEPVAAAVRQAVEGWLGAVPGLAVLLTARERPGVGDTHAVGPLAPQDAAQLLEARRPAGSPRDAAAEARLLSLLEGVPQAIELAAAVLATTPAASLATSLAQGHAVFPAPVLEEALGASLVRLSPFEREAFVQLAVFGGGFTAAAARGVVALPPGAPALEVVLDQLCVRSLLRRLPEAEERFGLFAVPRAFGLAHLDAAGALAAVGERHTRYFLHEGSRWAAGAQGYLSAEFARTLAAETDNLLLVHARALAVSPPTATSAGDALCAALVLEPLLSLRGPTGLLRALLDSALAAAGGQAVHGPLLVRGRLARGGLLRSLGHLALAAGDLDAALRQARALGDEALEGQALGQRGVLRIDQAAYPAAEGDLERALALAVRRGDTRAEALARGQLAMVSLEAGRLDEAQGRYRAASQVLERLGDGRLEGLGVGHLGTLYLELGQVDDAQACLALARQLLDDAGDRRGAALFSAYAAQGELLAGRTAPAVEGLARAREALRGVGELRYEALFSACQGAALAGLGRPTEARALLDAAADRLAALGDDVFLEAVHLYRGCLAATGAPAGPALAHRDDNDVRLAARLVERLCGGASAG